MSKVNAASNLDFKRLQAAWSKSDYPIINVLIKHEREAKEEEEEEKENEEKRKGEVEEGEMGEEGK